MNIWEAFTVEESVCYFRKIGPVRLWIRKQLDEWNIGWDYVSTNTHGISEQTLDTVNDTDIGWHRKVVRKNQNTVKLVPVMPDRPVVVKPESELKIVKNAGATFFVRIPLWLKVVTRANSLETLYEIPTVVLSNTWFGEPDDGELCYSMKTFARRSLTGVEPQPHLAICPIHIKNNADVDLIFKRLCIQVNHLGIYQSGSEMWANPLSVQFRGEDKESSVKYEDSAPKTDKEVTLIGQPRKKHVRGFARKSFDTFKFLSNGI